MGNKPIGIYLLAFKLVLYLLVVGLPSNIMENFYCREAHLLDRSFHAY